MKEKGNRSIESICSFSAGIEIKKVLKKSDWSRAIVGTCHHVTEEVEMQHTF